MISSPTSGKEDIRRHQLLSPIITFDLCTFYLHIPRDGGFRSRLSGGSFSSSSALSQELPLPCPSIGYRSTITFPSHPPPSSSAIASHPSSPRHALSSTSFLCLHSSPSDYDLPPYISPAFKDEQ
ncbi:unnamed protein product [Linum trigynum]|uniref:Uncharacterized protein n=1 Tax=Linum trigynum TaxID=586398 RepID=A0AAV2FC33_9ROSI